MSLKHFEGMHTAIGLQEIYKITYYQGLIITQTLGFLFCLDVTVECMEDNTT